jgi:glycosyltransferase involved in cell wall biosynthesis
MHCPRLNELPPPPSGKTGWPWTEDTPITGDPAISHYDRITIVTPSYNSVAYLEETIRSVLLQGYPDLEYIIIDGGSTDGALDIIAKYAKWITRWISEPDRGYADAINKGFALATGNIRAWIPASDLYAASAFHVANHYLGNRRNDLIFGRFYYLETGSNIKDSVRPMVLKNLRHLSLYGRSAPNQATTFWRREIHQQAGELNSTLRYAADSEWFLRLSLIGRCLWIPEIVCFYRQHPGQLSANLTDMTNEWYAAWDAVIRKHHISRLRIMIGALLIVPVMRYNSGGLKNIFRLPTLRTLTNTLFRRKQK